MRQTGFVKKSAQNSVPLRTPVSDMTEKPEIETSNKILNSAASTAITDTDLKCQSTTLQDAKQSKKRKLEPSCNLSLTTLTALLF